MIFNVLAKNCDDHVKNISFLMNRKGVWRLAPAYDLTYAYHPANRWLRAHQMSVNQKRSDITEKDMIACAAAMDISETKCRQLIRTAKEVISGFDTFAEQAELPSNVIERIQNEPGLYD